MAKNQWAILCHRASVDKDSLVLSLLEITEELTLSYAPQNPPANFDRGLLPVPLHLATHWIRSEASQPEKFKTKVNLRFPNLEVLASAENVGDLTQAERTRVIFQLQSLPFAGPGRYIFELLHSPDQDPPDWSVAAEVPLDVKVQPVPSS
jgi:hypothetical protein